ncbi:MAG TPA: 16S rRNA (cytidine(1402)-2'-O)-methyltransferase [Candidatus Binataceae bacterium]|nr:16S rRNA (cytidine(1402)-2'-O)-methyltransferase [Candidatus Binataceae bacterium]
MARENRSGTKAAGILYVVATPIGNPADVTLRALETLREADLIICEDTRRTGILLAAHQIKAPMLSNFEHNEARRLPEIMSKLESGAKLTLVTDAGTPGISDPGFRLVRAARAAGIEVKAIPGACAAIAALSIAGLPTDRFTFEGFLPAREVARIKTLEALRVEPRTMVFYEAPRRLREVLADMAQILGGRREAAVVREITKTHEETIRATLSELAEHFRKQDALGEITIVVEGASEHERAAARESGVTVQALVEAGMSLKDASAVIARLTGASRREIYQQALRSRGES